MIGCELPYYQPISQKEITLKDKAHGSRLPVGTKVIEYRMKVVYVYPSGKKFVRMKTYEEMRLY